MTGHSTQLLFRIPPPFDFELTLRGHGWYDLLPHEWNAEDQILKTAFQFEGQVLDCDLSPRRGGFRALIISKKPIADTKKQELKSLLLRMLRLDENFSDFWALCREDPQRIWAAERGAGRILRSATVFEDLMKLLFTTNCSWSLTRSMTRNLVLARGPRSVLGRRAFPAPKQLKGLGEDFYRDVVRTGYRAQAAVELTEAFLSGELNEEDLLQTGDRGALCRRLLSLRGFGPYAVGQACRLLGHYEDLALDSWCRGRVAEMEGRKKAPSDGAIKKRYAAFGAYAGLALWIDLTRDWHN